MDKLKKKIHIVVCRSKKVFYIPQYCLFLADNLKKNSKYSPVIHTVMNYERSDRVLAELKEGNNIVLLWETYSTKAYWYIEKYLRVAKFLKSNPNNTLIFGGFWATGYGRYFKELDIFDYMLEGFSIEKITGKITNIKNESSRFLDVRGELNWDKYSLNLDYLNNPEKYEHENKIAGYLSTFSCPRSCGFCFANMLDHFKTPFSVRSLKKVFKDLEKLNNGFNFEDIVIKDLNFFFDHNRAFKILDKLKEMGKYVDINLDVEVKNINEKLLKEVNKRDNFSKDLYIGLESFNYEHRKKVGKPYTDEKFNKILQLAKKYNITIRGNIILGFPWQNKEDIQKEINTAVKYINQYENVYIFMNIYKPEFGCSIQRKYFSNVHNKINFYQLIKIYKNKAKDIQRKLYGENFNFIEFEKVYNSFRLLNRIKYTKIQSAHNLQKTILTKIMVKLEEQLSLPFFKSKLINLFIRDRSRVDFFINYINPLFRINFYDMKNNIGKIIRFYKRILWKIKIKFV